MMGSFAIYCILIIIATLVSNNAGTQALLSIFSDEISLNIKDQITAAILFISAIICFVFSIKLLIPTSRASVADKYSAKFYELANLYIVNKNSSSTYVLNDVFSCCGLDKGYDYYKVHKVPIPDNCNEKSPSCQKQIRSSVQIQCKNAGFVLLTASFGYLCSFILILLSFKNQWRTAKSEQRISSTRSSTISTSE
ncbi:hypothetical protein GJ496_003322 [Pomphorhynchus laevis]|nr:hypothetical protein GJ496_003322 [Pomphorhynchus laevis]